MAANHEEGPYTHMHTHKETLPRTYVDLKGLTFDAGAMQGLDGEVERTHNRQQHMTTDNKCNWNIYFCEHTTNICDDKPT